MNRFAILALSSVLALGLSGCSSQMSAFERARVSDCENLVSDELVGGLFGYDSISFANESFSDSGSGNGVVTGSYTGDGGSGGLLDSMTNAKNTFQCSVSGTDVTLDHD